MRHHHRHPAAASLAFATALAGAACDDGGEPVVECEPVDDAAAIEHAGAVDGEEAWGPGLHLVTETVTVGSGASLVIEGCAVVRMAADTSIVVDDEAVGLEATGTAARPIVIERAEDAAPWGSVNAFGPATLRLSHTTLSGGGSSSAPDDAEFAGATVAVRIFGNDDVDLLFVDTVTVEDSAGLGVLLQGAGFIDGSTDLTVRGAGTHPVYLGAGHATHLPSLIAVDNGVDAILLQSVGAAVYDNIDPILHDAVIPDRGVPYQVGRADTGADIVVGDGRDESPSSLLLIEAGVELRFTGENVLGQLLVNGKGFGDSIAPQGALVVEGTPDRPVVFTSQQAAPAPGDWQGLYFDTVVDPRSRIEHAVIRFAGGESTTTGVCPAAQGAGNGDADCAIIFFTADAPPSAFITDSTIEDSAGCGIYRGWSVDNVDFTATNTFSGLGGCEQSNVPDDNNGCDTGPCQ
jgi:hypothetical protein